MKKAVALLLVITLLFSCVITASAQKTEKTDIFRYAKTVLNTVDNSEKVIYVYNTLVSEVPKMPEKISFDSEKGITGDILSVAFNAYINDYPECFWFDCNNYYTSVNEKTGILSGIYLEYLFEAKEMPSALNDFNVAVEKALNTVNDGMTDLEKEKALHDYITGRVYYGNPSIEEHGHTSYGALVEQRAVCDGYAKAMSYLCSLCGIRSHIVTGDSINPTTDKSEFHAWNVIFVNDNWYYCDTTWDSQDTGIFYCYFNNNKIDTTHSRLWQGYPVPEVNADLPSYYDEYGIVLEKFDVDIITELLIKNDYSLQLVCKEETPFIDWLRANNQANFAAIVRKLDIYDTMVYLNYYAMENEYHFGLMFERNIKLSGAIFGITDGDKPVITLLKGDEEIAVADVENGRYDFGEVPTGDYTVTVSCEGYVTRKSQVSVCSTVDNCDIELTAYGDVNGDGTVDNLDLVRICKFMLGYNVYVSPLATNIDNSYDEEDGTIVIDNMDILLLKKILVGLPILE